MINCFKNGGFRNDLGLDDPSTPSCFAAAENGHTAAKAVSDPISPSQKPTRPTSFENGLMVPKKGRSDVLYSVHVLLQQAGRFLQVAVAEHLKVAFWSLRGPRQRLAVYAGHFDDLVGHRTEQA